MRRFFDCERGMNTVEYLVGAGVVALIAIFAYIAFIQPAVERVENNTPVKYESSWYKTN